MRGVLLALISLAVGGAFLVAGCDGEVEQGRIAFVSDRDGNFEIYVMGANGSNQNRLTNNPAFDGFLLWSP